MSEVFEVPSFSEENRTLVERSRLFDQVLSSITDFVYTFDLEGRFTFINKPLLDLWGMTLEQAVGKNFFELPYPPDLAAKLHDQIQQVIRTQERVVDETRYDNPSGQIGFYQYIFSPVLDTQGNIEAVAGSTRDISASRKTELERERALTALKVDRANLGQVIEKAPSFICVLSGQEHTFELANELYLELIGRRDILGKTVLEVLPEVETQGFIELLNEVYKTGKPFVGNEIPVVIGPVGLLQHRVLNFVYQPLLDSEGVVDGIFVHGVDVTNLVLARDELKVSQEHLERQRRLYEAILNNSPDLMYVWGPDHKFRYVNEGLLRMWGKTWDEAIGKTCLELGYEPWHAEMHNREIDHVIATAEPIRGEVPFHGTFGRRTYDYILVPVFGANGEVEAVAGTTRDITDRVEMEEKVSEQADQLSQESRLKDEFLAMLSHELRNPLAPLRTAVDLLKYSQREDVRTKAQDIIERQLTNLTKIVNDLLEISRVVTGRILLDLEVVDLNQVVEHSIQTTRSLFDQRGHTLSVSLTPEPLWVLADPIRLEEVFINLLANAAKYTNDGGEIEVFCEIVDAEEIRFRVRDSGVGIDPTLLPRIFDLFTQADRSLDRSEGGLGIGLNLAQRLVNLHHGKVTAESPPFGRSVGSEFCVILPIASPESVKAKKASPSIQFKQSKYRILLVDDNEDVVSMVSDLLKLEGHTVRSAHDGTTGLALAKEWIPEIIILDIGLPGISGYEVAQELRSFEPTQKSKFIAVTGYGQKSDVKLAQEAGFDFHLTKPFSLSDLTKLF